MLPDGSFLNRLPRVIEPKQRLFLETTSFALNCVHTSYDLLWEKLASFHIDEAPHMSRRDRVFCFTQAWSVINHVHMLRGALLGFTRTLPRGFPIQPIEAFLKASEEARNIRRDINHIPELMGAKAALKGNVPPLFGAISYCLVAYEKSNPVPPPRAEKLYVVSLIGGALTADAHAWPVPNPVGHDLRFPVDFVEFTASQHRVDLSALVRDLGSLNSYFEDVIRAHVVAEAKRIAAERNLSVDALLAPQDEKPMPYLTLGPT
jgi:hypothetical protein